jgi:hypothetical protein
VNVMEQFDTELNAKWEQVKGSVTGLLYPQASATVQSELWSWLDHRLRLDDLREECPWRAAAGGPCPEYLIRCDKSNNPPSDIAEGKLSAEVLVLLFGQVWSWEWTIG